MDENTEKIEQSPPRGKRKRRRVSRRARIAVTVVVTAALVVLALLAFIYRDYLTAEGLRELFGGSSVVREGEPYSYEAGAGQVFALAGDGLAIASTTGLQLLDGDGYSVARQVFSMETPAVTACDRAAAFFDVGGTALRVADLKGECTTLDTEEPIISASMNSSGWLCVCTEKLGYKGMVTVYNDKLEAVYRWYSGTGWLIKAQVSPDCTGMAAMCLQSDGGSVRFFSLSTEEEQGVMTAPGELLVDFQYQTSGLCALSESAAYFMDKDGGDVKSFAFGDYYLTDYALSADCAAIYLSRYRGGGGGEIVTLGNNGLDLGRAEMQSDVTGLSLCSKGLLVWGPAGLFRYSRSMQLADARDDVLSVKYALYRERGDALIVSSYATEVLSLQ